MCKTLHANQSDSGISNYYKCHNYCYPIYVPYGNAVSYGSGEIICGKALLEQEIHLDSQERGAMLQPGIRWVPQPGSASLPGRLRTPQRAENSLVPREAENSSSQDGTVGPRREHLIFLKYLFIPEITLGCCPRS